MIRAVLASLVLLVGCSNSSRDAAPNSAAIVLQPTSGLPRFEIRATFDRDPAPHVQPIAAAIASARASCARSGLAALELDVHAQLMHATARNASAECLVRALDGAAIADPDEYIVALSVTAT